ncbi:MAG: hypothetical protein NTW86_07035 [Candidatus Sumerlaeota bacterium]|nr:hypothetical protein [Candidatus Sumerlaeota bacterium]
MNPVRHLIALIAAPLLLSLCAPIIPADWLDPASPAVETVLCGGDNQFSWYDGPEGQQEWTLNLGEATAIRMKGSQDVAAFKFDLSSFPWLTVEDAELHLARADAAPIFAMVAATINADWDAGSQSGAEAGVGESCWRWRRRPVDFAHPDPSDEWAFPHSDFSVASFGNYGSLVCYACQANGTFGTYTSGGRTWIRMKLDPALVHALALDQHGLAVTDPRGYNTNYNPRVCTKEQGDAVRPRLLVRFSPDKDVTPPEAVGSLRAQPGPNDAEAVLSFTAPKHPQTPAAFGYTIRVSRSNEFAKATDLARWRIPRPATPGVTQKTLVEGLTPGEEYHFFVLAYDQVDNKSPIAHVALRLPEARSAPELADGALPIPAPTGKSVRMVRDVLRYWVCSEPTKVNPATGARMEDGYNSAGSEDYKKANAVWDAAANAVSLRAARNEVVGFQLILERLRESLRDVRIEVGDLTGPGGAVIPADPNIERFLLHYVADNNLHYPDAAIPLRAPFHAAFSIPDRDHNPGGVNQSVWIDVYVPRDARPGDYTGSLSIAARELPSSTTLVLRLRVSPVTLPDESTFLIDLNGYGAPWDYGAPRDYGDTGLTRLRYFQAAHKHRMSMNTLPYGWSAHIEEDRAPTLTGAGPNVHAADWTLFDAHYGPFFDGSAFRADTPGSSYIGPGADTPVSTFYTCLFESWPIPVLDPKYGYDATGKGGQYWDMLIGSNPDTFFANAPDVLAAFSDDYKQGVRNVVKEWLEHAQAKGWSGTSFQTYLNNKYTYDRCAALWTLEECGTADDFRAVGFFQSLFREGAEAAKAPDVRRHWRLDISDHWSQSYGQVDNIINWVVMNRGDSDWNWPNLRYRNILLGGGGEKWAWYGTGPGPQDRGDLHAQQFLQSWAQGLDGGVPYWDNFQTDWTDAQRLSLVYSGKNVPGFGHYDGPVLSIRVKMMRQAEQLVELANLLAKQKGWDRQRVTKAIVSKYGDGGWNYTFSKLGEAEIYRLHADLLATLEPYFAK